MDLDKATARAANSYTLWLALSGIVTGAVVPRLGEILDVPQPWRTIALVSFVFFAVWLLGVAIRFGRAVYLKRNRQRSSGGPPQGGALSGSQIGLQVTNSQNDQITDNLAIFGGAPIEFRPPEPRGPITPAVLNRLAERMERLVQDLQRTIDHEPPDLGSWEVRDLPEGEEQQHEGRRREWDSILRRLYDRMVVVYEEAADRGYSHQQMEYYWTGWTAGASYKSYPAWLSSIEQRMRDDASDMGQE